jgi:hypothetical protein
MSNQPYNYKHTHPVKEPSELSLRLLCVLIWKLKTR